MVCHSCQGGLSKKKKGCFGLRFWGHAGFRRSIRPQAAALPRIRAGIAQSGLGCGGLRANAAKLGRWDPCARPPARAEPLTIDPCRRQRRRPSNTTDKPLFSFGTTRRRTWSSAERVRRPATLVPALDNAFPVHCVCYNGPTSHPPPVSGSLRPGFLPTTANNPPTDTMR